MSKAKSTSIFLTVFLTLIFSSKVSLAQSLSDRFRLVLGQCKVPNVTGKAFCGTFKVAEEGTKAKGRTISLKLIVLSASTEKSQPDPLFILAGGPGQAATDNVEFYARVFSAVRAERDIVLVDQRGTGGSNPLKCDLYGKSVQGHLNDLIPIDAVRKCKKEWNSHADLRMYTTPIAMTDLNELREALGYVQINIFGTSYGTRAAQVFLRQYPAQVRSIILKGITPISENIPTTIAPDSQNSLEKVFSDCVANEDCKTRYPGIKEEFAALLHRFDKGPISFSYTNEKATENVTLSRGAVVTTIRNMLQSTTTIAHIPEIIHQAYLENYTELVKSIVTIRDGFASGVSIGVFLAVLRSEDLPFTKSREVERLAQGTFMDDYYYQQLRKTSSILPRAMIPSDYKLPVRSSVPVLLLSGYLDPATPPDNGEEVAQTLSNRLHLVVRYGSHSYSSLSPCVDKVMTEFIVTPDVKSLDTSCIGGISQTPFK